MSPNRNNLEDRGVMPPEDDTDSDRSTMDQEIIPYTRDTCNDSNLQRALNLESANENLTLLHTFPYTLLMKVSTSEPRDLLQLERTCLTFVRLASSLFFTALGIMLNFKLDTSGGSQKSSSTLFSVTVSFILLGLGFAALVISGIDYFITIDRYAKHKIDTYNFTNFSTVICMTCIIITLMGISISLIVEEYLIST